MKLDCAGRELDLSRPNVMGILNLTPDSFSDGGRFRGSDGVLDAALRMVADGVDLIDVGGESTRPGAMAVPVQQEIDRVVPVVELLATRLDCPISVDTSKPAVMSAAVAAGAGMINDVSALRGDGALETATALQVPVCLMHMRGEPRTMQENPQYDDVIDDIIRFLADRVTACEAAGMARASLLVDPGFGFGKSLAHNLSLLRGLGRFRGLGVPVVAGLSRKSMLGAITGRGVAQRLIPSVASALIAVQRGAAIVRVHDVAETVDALKLWGAVDRHLD